MDPEWQTVVQTLGGRPKIADTRADLEWQT